MSAENCEGRLERLYQIMRNEKTGHVSVAKFLNVLFQNGLQQNDPRLRDFFDKLQCMCSKTAHEAGYILDPDDETFAYTACHLTREDFFDCVREEEKLIFRAFTGDLVIPEFDHFTSKVKELFEKCAPNTGGHLADYIPQLTRFNPKSWAVSVCTIDGQRYSIGDSTVPFCLQSGSKALNYALALNDNTSEEVHSHIGQEPSGGTFNALTLNQDKRPHNPMINSGAIATISMIKTDQALSDRFDYVLTEYKRMAGGQFVGFSNATFLSEREAANRNFALGYYMQENKVFPKAAKLKDTMDLYFQLCSVEVTAESASVMAATLANGGICPLTNDVVLKGAAVRDTLSLMLSCGMSDYSGQFAFQVGLPAKSGISGVILLVIPNVAGICLWSPLVDDSANSVRGIQFCEEMIKKFNVHQYDAALNCHSNSQIKYDPRRSKIATVSSEIVALLTNASRGDLSALKRFHNRYGDAIMNQADYDGRTALHLAAAEGNYEVVEFLLKECKVNPKPQDRYGGTPSEDAKNAGRKDIIELIKVYEQKYPNTDKQQLKQLFAGKEDTVRNN